MMLKGRLHGFLPRLKRVGLNASNVTAAGNSWLVVRFLRPVAGRNLMF